ncbi:hypothetical protein GCM10010458_23750 [Microbacterium luteolum]
MRCEEAQSAGDIRSLGSADTTRHPLLWECRGWEAAALSQGLGDLGTPRPFWGARATHAADWAVVAVDTARGSVWAAETYGRMICSYLRNAAA